MIETLTLTKTYSFEAAHQLPDWPDVHGHSYEVDIAVRGTGDYAVELETLDQHVLTVLKQIDHRFLNDVIPFPTMENIARWLWQQLKDSLTLDEIIVRRPTLRLVCRYRAGNEAELRK